MQIRPEAPGDHSDIAALITEAFLTAPHSDGTEAQLVSRLRASDALILSLVTEREGRLIGHIAASPCEIGAHAGYALIAPLAVRPDAQRQGVGQALMEAAMSRISAAGFPGAALVGDPDYYARFGFEAREGLSCAGIPDHFVLSRGMAGPAPTGLLTLHPAFTAKAS